MRAYADTSFLFALMLRDTNSPMAGAYLRAHRQALPLTSLQRCELTNAFRLAVFRKQADSSAAKAALIQVDTDLAAGNLVTTPLTWPEVFCEAESLGEKHTAALGIRTLDLLHIGAALTLGLKNFLTFDHRQRACAKAAGLHVGP
jgi:predicted nucleic acid-binding protein